MNLTEKVKELERKYGSTKPARQYAAEILLLLPADRPAALLSVPEQFRSLVDKYIDCFEVRREGQINAAVKLILSKRTRVERGAVLAETPEDIRADVKQCVELAMLRPVR